MPTVHIHLNVNHERRELSLANPKFKFHHGVFNPFGKAVPGRIILRSRGSAACLTVRDGVPVCDIAGMAAAFRDSEQSPLTLVEPFMAIHAVRAGAAFPDDHGSEPLSLFDCRPREDWVGMEAEPPVEAEHPLLTQPPNTLSFETAMGGSNPLRVHYDSIVRVELRDYNVLIVVNQAARNELVGMAEVTTTDRRLATRLAEAIRQRQVRRIQPNRVVSSIKLVPCVAACTGGRQQASIRQRSIEIRSGSEEIKYPLLQLARQVSAEDVAAETHAIMASL